MKEKTKQRLAAIDKAHDWAEGRVWGGPGTLFTQTDVCRFCGLRREWSVDRQNGQDEEYRFVAPDGTEIPTGAVPLTCG